MEIQKIFTDYSGERFYSVRLSEPELNFYQKEFGIANYLNKATNLLDKYAPKIAEHKDSLVAASEIYKNMFRKKKLSTLTKVGIGSSVAGAGVGGYLLGKSHGDEKKDRYNNHY